jgi:serine protease Do
LIGTDEGTDLAVLRIDVGDEALHVLPFADSDGLEVGDLVIAIGNPFGVGQTVTSGIVSGLARTRIGLADYSYFIQTDAAINPGNSGGALVTMDGELAGINTAIFSQSGGSIGVGFAIPSNMVAAVVTSIIEQGRVIRPWLGVILQNVTPDLAESLGLGSPHGGLIADVAPNSPAETAGLQRGDVVIAIAGQAVLDSDAVRFRIGTYMPGASVRITVWRDGAELELDVTLQSPPSAAAEASAVTLAGSHPLAGAKVADLSSGLIYERALRGVQAGVLVLAVEEGSAAARIGLQPNDVIVDVNGNVIDSVESLQAALQARATRWQISINRAGEVLTMSLRE